MALSPNVRKFQLEFTIFNSDGCVYGVPVYHQEHTTRYKGGDVPLLYSCFHSPSLCYYMGDERIGWQENVLQRGDGDDDDLYGFYII